MQLQLKRKILKNNNFRNETNKHNKGPPFLGLFENKIKHQCHQKFTYAFTHALQLATKHTNDFLNAPKSGNRNAPNIKVTTYQQLLISSTSLPFFNAILSVFVVVAIMTDFIGAGNNAFQQVEIFNFELQRPLKYFKIFKVELLFKKNTLVSFQIDFRVALCFEAFFIYQE